MKRTTGRPAYLLTSKTRNSTRGAAKTSFLLLAVARSSRNLDDLRSARSDLRSRPRLLRAMARHLLPLLTLLLPTCTDALLPAVARPALRRSGPSMHRRSAAPLLAAAGAPPPPQAAWRLGDELDRRIASLALPAVVSFMILPIAQATDLFWVGRMGEAPP